MWPYFVPRVRDYEGLKGDPPSLSLGKLAELWRAIRMFECAKAVEAMG